MRARATAHAALIAAGVLVLQLGWVFAVPAFGGIDEVDHAYRAASVARGHWAASDREVAEGRGTLIRVPEDMVRAAHDRCAFLPYTGRFNCSPYSEPNADGEVLVASGASRYNPAYYWIVGTAAKPFNGAAALYAMRLTSALLCAALLFAALWTALTCSRSGGPATAILLGITPVLLYGTSVAAPNGVHMAGALLMWVTGIAVLTEPRGREGTLVALIAAALPAVLLTHSLGMIWVALTALTLSIAWPRRIVELWRRKRRDVAILGVWCAVLIGIAGSWILTQKANIKGDQVPDLRGWEVQDLLLGLVSWSLQTIGALPFRNEYLPVPVFVIVAVPFVVLVVTGFIKAAGPPRRAMVLVAGVTLISGPLFTILTYPTLGFAWQGRYALPYSIGLLLMAAWVLDRRYHAKTPVNVLIPVSAATFLLSQVFGQIAVARRQLDIWPSTHTLEPPSTILLLAVSGLTVTFVATGVILAQRTRTAVSGVK